MTGFWKRAACLAMIAALMIGSAIMLEGCKETENGNGATPTDQEIERELEGAGDEFEDAAKRGQRSLEEAGEDTGEVIEDTGEAIRDTGEEAGEEMEDLTR